MPQSLQHEQFDAAFVFDDSFAAASSARYDAVCIGMRAWAAHHGIAVFNPYLRASIPGKWTDNGMESDRRSGFARAADPAGSVSAAHSKGHLPAVTWTVEDLHSAEALLKAMSIAMARRAPR
jgi:hypothetical protein